MKSCHGSTRRHIMYLVSHTRAPFRGRLTTPASLAQGRMQLKHVKGQKDEAHDFVRLENLYAKSCLCRAINSCPVLCTVLCACCRCHILVGNAGVICGRGET